MLSNTISFARVNVIYPSGHIAILQTRVSKRISDKFNVDEVLCSLFNVPSLVDLLDSDNIILHHIYSPRLSRHDIRLFGARIVKYLKLKDVHRAHIIAGEILGSIPKTALDFDDYIGTRRKDKVLFGVLSCDEKEGREITLGEIIGLWEQHKKKNKKASLILSKMLTPLSCSREKAPSNTVSRVTDMQSSWMMALGSLEYIQKEIEREEALGEKGKSENMLFRWVNQVLISTETLMLSDQDRIHQKEIREFIVFVNKNKRYLDFYHKFRFSLDISVLPILYGKKVIPSQICRDKNEKMIINMMRVFSTKAKASGVKEHEILFNAFNFYMIGNAKDNEEALFLQRSFYAGLFDRDVFLEFALLLKEHHDGQKMTDRKCTKKECRVFGNFLEDFTMFHAAITRETLSHSKEILEVSTNKDIFSVLAEAGERDAIKKKIGSSATMKERLFWSTRLKRVP